VKRAAINPIFNMQDARMKPPSKLNHWLAYAALLSLVGLLAGCATPTKAPVYVHEHFKPVEVDCITLLPVLDLRQGNKGNSGVSASVLSRTKSMLEKKHYPVVLDSNADAVAKLTRQQLDSDEAEWVKRFPCSGSRWIMIFAVHEVGSLKGYLFDREKGIKLWQDTGMFVWDPQAGAEVAYDVVTLPFLSSRMLNQAISNCMLSFPARPEFK
jgi:hypothetical protein